MREQEEKKEVMGVLQGSIAYFDKISQNMETEMDAIRVGGDLTSVADLLDGIMVLLEMFDKTSKYHSIDPRHDTIKKLMSELVEGFENQDKGLVADIIEYEFRPILDDWRDAVQNVLENDV